MVQTFPYEIVLASILFGKQKKKEKIDFTAQFGLSVCLFLVNFHRFINNNSRCALKNFHLITYIRLCSRWCLYLMFPFQFVQHEAIICIRFSAFLYYNNHVSVIGAAFFSRSFYSARNLLLHAYMQLFI